MSNKDAVRILILGGKGRSTGIVFHYLQKQFKDVHVIIEEKPPRMKFLKRRAKRLGWGKVIGQVLFMTIILPVLNFFSKKRKKIILEKNQMSLAPISTRNFTQVPSVNSKASIEKIKAFQPDVIVVNGTRIISKKVLQSVEAKFINTHAGITPLYRGVHGGYWALAMKDRANCGVTVHLVDEGIDTGNIIAQANIFPDIRDNFCTYPLLQLAEGLPLLKQAIQDIKSNHLVLKPSPTGKSQLWYHPTLIQFSFNYLVKGVK